MELELMLAELQPLNLVILAVFFFLHYRIWSLCYQPLLQFSTDVSQTLQTIVEILKIYIWVCDRAKINFD